MAAQLTAAGYTGTTAVFDPAHLDSVVQSTAGTHTDITALTDAYGVNWHVDAAFGAPPHTVNDATLTATFMELVGPVISVPQAEALVVAVHELPNAPSIQPLIELLSVSV